MFYYVDDSDGSLWAYDLAEQARDGLRGPLTDEEVYAIQHPPLTTEQILAQNTIAKDNFADIALRTMLPHVLLAIDFGGATDSETVSAKAWQTYYRALKAVDLTPTTPDWPVPPQK